MRISRTGLRLPPLKGLLWPEPIEQKRFLLKRRFSLFPAQMISDIRRHLRGVEEDEPDRMPITELWAKYEKYFRLGTVVSISHEERATALARKFDVKRGEHLQYVQSCIEKVKEYETELDNLEREALRQRYREQIEGDAQERQTDLERTDRLRFFNRSSATVDYDYWMNQHYWTADEATALSFDKDPRKVNSKTLAPMREGSAFAQSYFSRKQIIRRAIEAGDLNDVSERGKYIRWAKKTKLCQFDARLVSTGGSATDTSSKENPKSLRVLGDALLGALIYHYFLDSKAEQNRAGPVGVADAVSFFCTDITKAGIEVDKKTIRKHLNDALGRVEATKPPKGKMQDKLNAIKKQLLTAYEAERG